MKVIASTGGGWILQCTDEELAKLAGYVRNDIADRNGYFNGSKRLGVGSEVSIAPMYDYMHQLRHIESQLNSTREKLEAVAKLLTIPGDLKPICDGIIEEIKMFS